MAYKIEDINWNEMPEGAVEFSLEDEDYFFTWFDEDGNYWNYQGLMVRPSHKYDDGRKRHSVRDYHPSSRKPTREERLDTALRTLVQTHFFGSGLEWSWKEGKSLEDMDPSLHKEIVDLLNEVE